MESYDIRQLLKKSFVVNYPGSTAIIYIFYQEFNYD